MTQRHASMFLVQFKDRCVVLNEIDRESHCVGRDVAAMFARAGNLAL